jgi:hypothetical protein
VSADEHELPRSLERFGQTLVARLHVARRNARRRRLAGGCMLATVLLAGTAIAATRALDGPAGYRISKGTFVLDPAQVLYGGYARQLRADVNGQRMLLTLPPHANGYGNAQVLITPFAGGDCLLLQDTTFCGPSPNTHAPVLGVLAPAYGVPFVYAGVEAPAVVRHVIRCGSTTRDVTSNAGAHAFVFVAPRGVPESACRQTATLADGERVTSRLR